MHEVKDCSVTFRASSNGCNSTFLIIIINTSKQSRFGPLLALLSSVFVGLAIVNASRLCTPAAARCVLFVQGLFYPCKQVVHTFEKSSVCAVAGLKVRFMSLFIWEEFSTLQACLSFLGSDTLQWWIEWDSFLLVFPTKHSFMWWKRSKAFEGPAWRLQYPFFL